jgi:hypothetical protein
VLSLDRPASVAFTLQRRVADKRYGPPKRFSLTVQAGRARVSISRAALGRRAGAYKLTATPSADGVTGVPRALRFRVP